MNRIKSLRLARGYTQDELVRLMGGIITKQALSKYELDKSKPSGRIAIRLAKALDVKAIELFTPPMYEVDFIAYRSNFDFSDTKQKQVEQRVAEELEKRLLIQERMGVANEFSLERKVVASLDEVERIAQQTRTMWNLGDDPIGNLTNVLEVRGIHILPIQNAPDKFHGLAAYAKKQPNIICGAMVAYDNETVGERQRFTLAHELGHLFFDVSEGLDEEKAAHRFAGSFLMPAAEMYRLLGRSRRRIEVQELKLLKKHFMVSMQSVIYRAKNLEIITPNTATILFRMFNKYGWKRDEPNPIPREVPTLWTQFLLRGLSERLLAPNDTTRWGVSLEENDSEQDAIISNRRLFMELPKDEQDTVLRSQAEEMKPFYESGHPHIEWVEEYVEDEWDEE